ncbi:MAG: helix-turn-helix transcriptional regulator [Spirosomataceae bacterium]
MTIGSKLRKLRNLKKLSQQEVADMLNVKSGTYRSWEADQTQIKAKYLPKLAEIFGVAVTDLLSETTITNTIKPNESVVKKLFDTLIEGIEKLLEKLKEEKKAIDK